MKLTYTFKTGIHIYLFLKNCEEDKIKNSIFEDQELNINHAYVIGSSINN